MILLSYVETCRVLNVKKHNFKHTGLLSVLVLWPTCCAPLKEKNRCEVCGQETEGSRNTGGARASMDKNTQKLKEKRKWW